MNPTTLRALAVVALVAVPTAATVLSCAALLVICGGPTSMTLYITVPVTLAALSAWKLATLLADDRARAARRHSAAILRHIK